MKTIIVSLIKCYQTGVSPLLPARCRFYPTCSEYTIRAIEKHSVLKGLWYGLLRISKCHPFHAGGVDEEKIK